MIAIQVMHTHGTVNENALNAKEYLNRRTISLDFPQSGYQVVKVIISDMKGGVSSQNVVFQCQ